MARKNKGYSLELRENGTYWVRWYENGRRRTLSTRQTGQEAALRFLVGYLAREDAGESSLLTVGRCMEVYFDGHVQKKVIAKERVEFAIKALEPLHDTVLCDLRPEAVDRWASDRGVSDGTIRRDLGVLKAAIRYAVKLRLLVPSDVPWFDMPDAPPPKERWLTEVELKKLIEAASYVHELSPDGMTKKVVPVRLSRLRRFILIAYFTASRRSAIETLRWDQVDLKGKKINLNQKGRRQTNKRRPVVPILPGLEKTLMRAKLEATTPFVLDHPGDIGQSFTRLARSLGWDDVTPHTLRHTWAVHAAQAGKQIYSIAGMLGDSIQTVERNYLHHCPDHLRESLSDAR